MELPDISLIIPATDETYSLRQTIEQARHHLSGYRLECIIPTSPKLTTNECRAVIASLANGADCAIVTFDQTIPRLGSAIQESFSKATGRYTVLMAADLETDPTVLPLLIAELEDGSDIAVTSRWSKGVHFIGYDPMKLVMNFFFQLFFRLLYWTRLTDLTYAYRAYRTEILNHIRWQETQFPFLFETILKPLRLGYKVTEVIAPWKARTEGISHNSLSQTLRYITVGIHIRFMKKSQMVH